MKNTIIKLNEADFFLNKLIENKNVFPDNNYYLNAFVGSGRSVLWIMKSEHSKNNNFIEWFDKKETTEKEDKLLEGIKDMRNRSIKKEPIEIETFPIINLENEYIDVIEEIRSFTKFHGSEKKFNIKISESNCIKSNIKEFDNKSIYMNGTLNLYDTVKEFKNSHVIEKCEEYISWLKNIVEESLNFINNS